jgi:RNA polymerase sigma-70 factor (ECF subfamily)
VQDTFLSLEKVPQEKIRNVKAYLCKILTNRCLDFLKSARRQREVYVGPWLAEPLVFRSNENELMEQVVNRDRLSIAYVTLMETLSPPERAVFILREVLDFSYREIAEIVGKEEAACRKIYSRVKNKLKRDLPEQAVPYERHSQLLGAFLQAIHREDTTSLLELLSADVILYSDGGGKVPAAMRPIPSRERVIAFLLGIAKKAPGDLHMEIANVNGEPGVILYAGQAVDSVFSLRLQGERIAEIYIVRNPDKLQRVPYRFSL